MKNPLDTSEPPSPATWMKAKAILSAVAVSAAIFAAIPAQAQLDIPMTAIGRAGNAADTTTFGAVDYNYNIGTSAVTNAQYAAFLNSVAKSDPYELYHKSMESIYGGITRSGTDGNYTYTATRADAPVNYVSFHDAARFSNWLTNGANANANASTEFGMYTLADGGLGMTRNAEAWANGGYAIVSENEWYKAAYYNLEGGYYTKYATGDTVSQDQANYSVPGSSNNVKNTSDVHAYDPEQNGTLGMMGNVWEWNESIHSRMYRGLRGGSYYNEHHGLDAAYEYFSFPAGSANGYIGFRVASLGAVPEPTTYASILSVVVLGVSLWWNKRRAR